MTTIDHAAEARRLISGAQNPPAGMTTEEVGITAAMAQVHATLALVEQQRIANVVTLMSMPEEAYDRLAINTNVKALLEGLGLS